jgi:aldehyde dehydrogenase (NAD+)
LKRTTLELGGKSPNIVFDDCDFEKTAITSLEAVYMNAGQCCCAGTRLLVQDTIHDKFVNRVSTTPRQPPNIDKR